LGSHEYDASNVIAVPEGTKRVVPPRTIAMIGDGLTVKTIGLDTVTEVLRLCAVACKVTERAFAADVKGEGRGKCLGGMSRFLTL
jgi:hypothetical protein